MTDEEKKVAVDAAEREVVALQSQLNILHDRIFAMQKAATTPEEDLLAAKGMLNELRARLAAEKMKIPAPPPPMYEPPSAFVLRLQNSSRHR